jgi:hypothetical protein
MRGRDRRLEGIYHARNSRLLPDGRVEGWRGVPKVKPSLFAPRFLWDGSFAPGSRTQVPH